MCMRDSYVCGLHFVSGNGPTEFDPDPISAVDVFLFLFFSCHTKSRFSDRISFMENNGLKNIPTVNEARKKMILQSGTLSVGSFNEFSLLSVQ